METREQALRALILNEWEEKSAILQACNTTVPVDTEGVLTEPHGIPGRPDSVQLVQPAALAHRSVHTTEGRAVLIHALAHIEFNAINLALDAVWRFPGMPEAYYRDWMQVAREESLHFGMLSAHLQSMGYGYGDFPAHDGLWEMAMRTQEDLLARLALVPRTLEARGLDASPLIRHKLASSGDKVGAGLLDIILRDEIGHVAIGNRWFRWLCEQKKENPLDAYERLARLYRAPKLKGPFNVKARLEAGFDAAELERLQSATHA
jgi:uncharacterized ferritin-like protein (DUF455 family)